MIQLNWDELMGNVYPISILHLPSFFEPSKNTFYDIQIIPVVFQCKNRGFLLVCVSITFQRVCTSPQILGYIEGTVATINSVNTYWTRTIGKNIRFFYGFEIIIKYYHILSKCYHLRPLLFLFRARVCMCLERRDYAIIDI